MKQKLAALLVMFAYLGGYAADNCEVFPQDNRIYSEILERMGKLEGKAPSKIAFCGEYGLYWKSYWDAFELPDDWKKRAKGYCWGEREDQAVRLYSCSRSIYLASSQFEGEIRLAHDLNIKLVEQLIEAARRSIGPKDRIAEIEYTPVRDGGAWSAIEYGYQVKTSNYPNYQRGKVLHIVLVCGPAPCTLTVVGNGIWAS